VGFPGENIESNADLSALGLLVNIKCGTLYNSVRTGTFSTLHTVVHNDYNYEKNTLLEVTVSDGMVARKIAA
jgi:hypothetical protein